MYISHVTSKGVEKCPSPSNCSAVFVSGIPAVHFRSLKDAKNAWAMSRTPQFLIQRAGYIPPEELHRLPNTAPVVKSSKSVVPAGTPTFSRMSDQGQKQGTVFVKSSPKHRSVRFMNPSIITSDDMLAAEQNLTTFIVNSRNEGSKKVNILVEDRYSNAQYNAFMTVDFTSETMYFCRYRGRSPRQSDVFRAASFSELMLHAAKEEGFNEDERIDIY